MSVPRGGEIKNAQENRTGPLGPAFARGPRMTAHELKPRTKAFAVEIVKFTGTLPVNTTTAILVRQLLKSGTSVGANYRASCRAKSRADFIAKMTTAEEEADETRYWLELMVDARIVAQDRIAALLDEAEQLVRIFVTSIKTARGSSR
ncbi:MAG: four helix bundle protein [Acidobacteria bacterium]|nr:four helix bundle protein [Acidobacteriota bacterium]